MYDMIGDIHGYANKLVSLLEKLGYTIQNGSYCHHSRKVIFLGDYIDRGPQIRETLDIVRKMVDQGNAIALMGNHEYNAICFHTPQKDGGYLREHSIKNIHQHYETLKQFKNKQNEYNDYISWFKTLPLFFESDEFRAVHACWDYESIAFLKKSLKGNMLDEQFIIDSCQQDNQANKAIEIVLKGKEISIPRRMSFMDKDGTWRNEIRIKWWLNPTTTTFRKLSVIPLDNLPDQQLDPSFLNSLDYYLFEDKPVFFGHYWLTDHVEIQQQNICCLDYSVAKGGKLAAYRSKFDRQLSNANLVAV